MHWSYRANAVSFAILTVAGAYLAAGFWPGDPGWAVAGWGGTAVFAAVAVLLWRGVSWAAPIAMGLAGFSLGLWVESTIALTLWAGDSAAANTSFWTCTAAVVASTLASGLLWTIPRTFALRHLAALALAGASTVPAVVFAMAPTQSGGVALAMAIGSLTVLAGAVAVGRGRTWGLFANLAGAAVLAVGVTFAPWLGTVSTAHALLPNCTGFLVDILGITAATLAGLSTAVYAAPLVRFVARGR